tara:strand:+ start:1572 stop:2441 length:870 start_codon:yes stop_codon:yes gene_type:complete
MLVYNAFTKSNIIEYANEVLAQESSRIRVADIVKVEGDLAVALTTRGAKLALVMSGLSTLSVMTFRSINKIKNKNKRWTYLINGQAGVNLETIVFSGETGKRFYANAGQLCEFMHGVYSNMKDEGERLQQVNKRVSWEAKVNHVIQNNLIEAFKLVVSQANFNTAFDYGGVAQDEIGILYSISKSTGEIVDKWVGEFNLSTMLATVSSDKAYFLTKVDGGSNDKQVRVAMAFAVWDHLGDVPTDEDGELLDDTFLHYSVGDDVHDVWHWVEGCFDISIGNDILYKSEAA